MNTGLPEYIGRVARCQWHLFSNDRSGAETVALMTAYEIISIFIGILALLMSFGSLILALLAFLDKRKRNKHK
jgi:hypothetical protein